MEHITNESLQHLETRISYLKAFLDLTNIDAEILSSAQPLINPLIQGILNAVYTKLLSFDITASIFVPKYTDENGKMTLAHPQIVMRKDFLRVCQFSYMPCFQQVSSSFHFQRCWSYLSIYLLPSEMFLVWLSLALTPSSHTSTDSSQRQISPPHLLFGSISTE
jgi:hypothetical protein